MLDIPVQNLQKKNQQVRIHYIRNINTVLCGEENQPDATLWFIELVICSTYFGHFYAHHQELETILLVTRGVSCCKDGKIKLVLSSIMYVLCFVGVMLSCVPGLLK
jgi:hypothetical protein